MIAEFAAIIPALALAVVTEGTAEPVPQKVIAPGDIFGTTVKFNA
jgi:hypothetical protein